MLSLREHLCGAELVDAGRAFSTSSKNSRNRPGFRDAGPSAGDHDDAFHAFLLSERDPEFIIGAGRMRMGGMAAQIPIKSNPQANEEAMAKVLADKEREATDRTRRHLRGASGIGAGGVEGVRQTMHAAGEPDFQIARGREGDGGGFVAASDGNDQRGRFAREHERGHPVFRGVAGRPSGCVPLYNLMEDAATAEISRSQVWQWLKYGVTLTDAGRKVTAVKLYDDLLGQESLRIEKEIGSTRYQGGHFAEATKLFSEMSKSAEFGGVFNLAVAHEIIGIERSLLSWILASRRAASCNMFPSAATLLLPIQTAAGSGHRVKE